MFTKNFVVLVDSDYLAEFLIVLAIFERTRIYSIFTLRYI